MMQIVLHVGMHKTGTTSVQQWLRDHQSELREKGIAAFPLDTRVCASRNDLFNPISLQHHLRQLEARDVERVIFSHEIMSTFSRAQFQLLRASLRPYPVKVVVTIRHWMGFLPARWRQNCRRRDAQNFAQFMSRMFENRDRFDFSFDQVLHNLQGDAGDELQIVPYEWARRDCGVLNWVLDAFGVPWKETDENMSQKYYRNVSNLGEFLEQRRLLNGVFSERTGRPENEMFDAFGQYRPFADVFDFGPIMRQLMRQAPPLLAELNERLSASEETFLLKQSDFEEAEQKLVTGSRSFLTSAEVMMPFPALEDVCVPYSSLGVYDLPIKLRENLMRELKRLAQGTGWAQKLMF